MNTDPPAVDVEKLREMLERGDDVVVLDVRTAAQRAEWSIPGSVHADAYEELQAGDPRALAEIHLDRQFPVVAVCNAGRTSLVAASLLRERGYDASTLMGGMKAWSLAWNVADLASPTATLVQVRRTGKG
jgi:rhodanese-related sulfurtransferase